MLYIEAMDYLKNSERFGMKLGLGRIEKLMVGLGNPQLGYKSIHVTGTNGKGSVCAFLYSILRESGYKVGLYTSPHLVDFRERIVVDGKKIPEEDVGKILSRVKGISDDATFFELTTAMALQHFREQKVDFAVIEVGMGGRLDATNVLLPEVSVITKVALDHTAHLGKTIKSIALEKSGIIKDGVPVVTAAKGVALEAIKRACARRGSGLVVAKESQLRVSMKGRYGLENASIALAAADILLKKGYAITSGSISSGLLKAKWPGRMDYVKKNMLFDCAHNPDGVKALVREIYGTPCVLVLGIMKDKDIKSMCAEFRTVADDVVVVKPKVDRASEPEQIASFFTNAKVIPDVKDGLAYAESISRGRLVVFTGSIFAVGEGFKSMGLEPKVE
jgi:dihydrofolate synthase / folylpolyglutamate synthase